MIDSIKEAIESFEPTDNTVKRKEFELYLLSKKSNVSLTGKKKRYMGVNKATWFIYKSNVGVINIKF